MTDKETLAILIDCKIDGVPQTKDQMQDFLWDARYLFIYVLGEEIKRIERIKGLIDSFLE